MRHEAGSLRPGLLSSNKKLYRGTVRRAIGSKFVSIGRGTTGSSTIPTKESISDQVTMQGDHAGRITGGRSIVLEFRLMPRIAPS